MADAAGVRLKVDLGALVVNWRELAAQSAPAECAAVVKADAYGIGIEPAVGALSTAGCRTFFVALAAEGRRVRAVAPACSIYVLNGFFPEAVELFREVDLRPVLNSLEEVEAWARIAGPSPSAIHVDTGMNRLGLSLHEAAALAQHRELHERFAPQLLMSHLACADTPDNPLNRAQLALFDAVRAEFPGLPASLANSAGAFLGPDYRFDLVRPGIALYGAAFAADRPPLSTVVTLEARILQVREAEAGETVGYGAAEQLKRDSRIAILSAGYADGYHRMAGSSGARPGAFAVLRGRQVPVLGRVSMDLIAVDVSGIPGVSRGEWVELFGPNMPIDAVAAAAGTIGYELLTGLSRRAERLYVK